MLATGRIGVVIAAQNKALRLLPASQHLTGPLAMLLVMVDHASRQGLGRETVSKSAAGPRPIREIAQPQDRRRPARPSSRKFKVLKERTR